MRDVKPAAARQHRARRASCVPDAVQLNCADRSRRLRYRPPWRASPISSARQLSVPPMPVITAVRTAAHPERGYERLVLNVTGPIPGYKIRYVTTATADPSGKAVSVPGRSYLLITLLQRPLSPGPALAASFPGQEPPCRRPPIAAPQQVRQVVASERFGSSEHDHDGEHWLRRYRRGCR